MRSLATIVIVLAAACGSSQKPAPAPAPTASTPAAEPTPPPAPPPASSNAALLPPGATSNAVPALQAIAQSEAVGAQRVGPVFAGQFEEGQTLEQEFNIDPGKCYTVIAVGLGDIAEVHIQIVLKTLPPALVASDTTMGSLAVLGGRASGCWKNASPFAVPGTVVLRAAKGAGTVTAQIWVK